MNRKGGGGGRDRGNRSEAEAGARLGSFVTSAGPLCACKQSDTAAHPSSAMLHAHEHGAPARTPVLPLPLLPLSPAHTTLIHCRPLCVPHPPCPNNSRPANLMNPAHARARSFIPIAGVIISTTPIGFVALTEYGFIKLGLVILMVTGVHFVEVSMRVLCVLCCALLWPCAAMQTNGTA